MPIDVTCSCGKRLRVADEFAGQQGQCPVCGGLVAIPSADAVLPGPPPALPQREQAVTARPGEPVLMASDASDLPVWPGADEPSPPWYKLYSPGSIGLVAFLTGPVGAFLLMAINFWRLGKTGAARLTVLAGVVTVAGVLVLSLSLPETTPTPFLFIGLPVFLMIWIGARTLQGSAYDEHLRLGGASASGWSAAGFGVLGIAVYFGIVYAALYTYDNHNFGPKMDFGSGQEVYYINGATQADAWALGTFLKRDGFFNGHGPASVRISRPKEGPKRLVIAFIVQDWVLNDAAAQQDLLLLGQDAGQQAFGGEPVEVHLCDEYFRVKKKLQGN
jgi:hypothetical protein